MKITEHDLDFSSVSNLRYCAGFTLPQLKQKLLAQEGEYREVAYNTFVQEYEGTLTSTTTYEAIRARTIELMQSTIFDWNFNLIANPKDTFRLKDWKL